MAYPKNTFLKENVPLTISPKGRSVVSGGLTLPINSSGKGSIRQLVFDLSIARPINTLPEWNIKGNAFVFSQSMNAGVPSPNDAINILFDDQNVNDYITLLPGQGIENFPFDKFWFVNAAIAGSTQAIIWIVNNPQTPLVLSNNG